MAPLPEINLSDVIQHLIHEISTGIPLFSHIDARRITVCIASGRDGRGGLCGKLWPLRFQEGHSVIRHGGRLYQAPEFARDGIPQLYIVYFYMPRFFDRPPREKINIILHELYHISPSFDGDIRRMGRKKAAHGHSREAFDSNFAGEAEEFYRRVESSAYMNFLSLDSAGLARTFRKVTGHRMRPPRPRIIGGDQAEGTVSVPSPPPSRR